MCDTDAIESLMHFLCSCPALKPCRARFDREAGAALGQAGEPGAELLRVLSGSDDQRVQALLGAAELVSEGDDLLSDLCAKARWMLDKLAKNFVMACWRLREALVGKLSIEHQTLHHSPSEASVERLLAQQGETGNYALPSTGAQEPWRDWIQVGDRRRSNRRKRGRAAFFVVWHGRETGLFYKWADCMRSVANVAKAKFKGFATLAEAEEAWETKGDAKR